VETIVETLTSAQFVATTLAAVAAFATVLALIMPIINRDQMNQRMKVMAVERDKMRSQRLAEMAARDRQGVGKLRQSPKGFMQQIVDRLDLRSQFDNEDVRNKLKMAGLRGQAPLVAYMFFRVAAPPIVFVIALFYLFVMSDTGYAPLMKVLIAIGIGALGF
jgi:tight adherence protein C